ncbi:hypothetical protein PV04_10665 [Phialophora macrospora]|uniref:Major facilitator superfamily (MFS) profile domain-containing protein n=1 Tax=Phialophora macrospora TaxID=1851006 RepID=A0A0D2DJI5_9EURO|nr:hypothetical protein PV04_10665 [Phialophora macrospora]
MACLAQKTVEAQYESGQGQADNTKSTSQLHVASASIDDEPIANLHAKTFLVVVAVFALYFGQVVNLVGLGALARDIANVVGGASQTTWLVNSVAILTSVLSPPVCQAADYWGRRGLLLGLSSFGVVGSIIISRATSMGMVICGSCVVGISYGTQPLIHAITSEVLPRKWRPIAQAICNTSLSTGALTGLLMGGSLTRYNDSEGFRIYWYITAGLYALAVIIGFFCYKPPTRKLQTTLTFSQKLQKLDWIGYVLLSIGAVLFSLGLCYGDNPYPWTSEQVLAPFLAGCAVLIVFGVYEWRFKSDGLFDHALFSLGRNFPIALVCIFCEGLTFFTANSYFAFEVSLFYESDPLLVGLRYGLSFMVFTVTTLMVGLYCSKTRKVRWPTAIGLSAFVLFNVCMATCSPTTNTRTWGYMIFLGLGLGCCLCAVVTIAQLSTPPELISITSGLMISMRSIAGIIGLPMYSAIFNSKLAAGLGKDIAAAVLPLGLPETSLPALIQHLTANIPPTNETVPGVTPEIIQAGVVGMLSAFSVAFRFIWITAAVFAFCAAVVATFLKDVGKELNMHIDAPAEKMEDLYDTDTVEAMRRDDAQVRNPEVKIPDGFGA